MKHAVEMGSRVMIYIPSFVKIGSGIQKLIRENTQTHREDGDCMTLYLFIYLFVAYLVTLSVTPVTQCQIICLIVYDELDRIWKEAVAAKSAVIARYMHGGYEKNPEKGANTAGIPVEI
jgi:hypothetical protein